MAAEKDDKPDSKSPPLNIRLPDGMKEKLEDYAYKLDCSVSELVVDAVKLELAKLKKEHGDVGPRPSRTRQQKAAGSTR
jgi:hypothetical protein